MVWVELYSHGETKGPRHCMKPLQTTLFVCLFTSCFQVHLIPFSKPHLVEIARNF